MAKTDVCTTSGRAQWSSKFDGGTVTTAAAVVVCNCGLPLVQAGLRRWYVVVGCWYILEQRGKRRVARGIDLLYYRITEVQVYTHLYYIHS